MSDLLRRGFAEDALRLEHHEGDEDAEDHRLPPRLTEAQGVVDVLDDPDEEAAQNGTREVADAAEHRRGEGDETEPEAGVPPGDAVGLHVEHARGPGQGATEGAGDGYQIGRSHV